MAMIQEQGPVDEENLTAATVAKTSLDPTMEMITMIGKCIDTPERQQTRSATTQCTLPEHNSANHSTTHRQRGVCWNCQQPGHIAGFYRQGVVPQGTASVSMAVNTLRRASMAASQPAGCPAQT